VDADGDGTKDCHESSDSEATPSPGGAGMTPAVLPLTLCGLLGLRRSRRSAGLHRVSQT